MLASTQSLHTSLPTPESIAVLVVSTSRDDYNAVCRMLRHGQWQITRTPSCKEAIEMMQKQSFAVILCETELADGTWRDLALLAARSSKPPSLLVISRHADDTLWSDVLNMGGYDVLPKPFDSAEFTRVIGMAWRHSLASWLRNKEMSTAFA